jgi:hypothetical protein
MFEYYRGIRIAGLVVETIIRKEKGTKTPSDEKEALCVNAERKPTVRRGLVEAMVCTLGALTSVLRRCPWLMAMENGWSGRKYMGYVLADKGKTSR